MNQVDQIPQLSQQSLGQQNYQYYESLTDIQFEEVLKQKEETLSQLHFEIDQYNDVDLEQDKSKKSKMHEASQEEFEKQYGYLFGLLNEYKTEQNKLYGQLIQLEDDNKQTEEEIEKVKRSRPKRKVIEEQESKQQSQTQINFQQQPSIKLNLPFDNLSFQAENRFKHIDNGQLSNENRYTPTKYQSIENKQESVLYKSQLLSNKNIGAIDQNQYSQSLLNPNQSKYLSANDQQIGYDKLQKSISQQQGDQSLLNVLNKNHVKFNYEKQNKQTYPIYSEQENKQEERFSFQNIAFISFIETILIIFIFTPIWIVLGFIRLFNNIASFKFSDAFVDLRVILSSSISVIITVVLIIEFYQKDMMISFFYLNPYIFYITQLFVFSYIKNINNQQKGQIDSFKEIFSFNHGLFNFGYQIELCEIYFDISKKDKQVWEKEIEEQSISIEVNYESQYFNYYFQKEDISQPKNMKKLTHKMNTLLIPKEDKNKKFSLNTFNTYILIPVVIKISGIIFYLYNNNLFSTMTVINITIIFLFYLKICFNYIFILKSQDLLTKISLIKHLMKIMTFDERKSEYEKKINITNIKSLQTWNNCRKIISNLFLDEQVKLELCYSFFLIHLIFSSMICLSVCFDFQYIFSKESIFLHPYNIFSNLIDILLLLLIILSRIYYGSKYNYKIDELQVIVEQMKNKIKGVINDFDILFSKHKYDHNDYVPMIAEYFSIIENNSHLVNQGLLQFDNISFQEVLLKKVRFIFEYYINSDYGDIFNGRLWYLNKNLDQFDKNIQMHDLEKSILSKMYEQFKKISKEIKTDKDEMEYKILNSVNINFYPFLNMIIIPLIPLLPNLSKAIFENFFKDL